MNLALEGATNDQRRQLATTSLPLSPRPGDGFCPTKSSLAECEGLDVSVSSVTASLSPGLCSLELSEPQRAGVGGDE
ncbi:hypothetical protein ACOMHN_001161 [Nucella lapillus]